jgi:hypothetical protein
MFTKKRKPTALELFDRELDIIFAQGREKHLARVRELKVPESIIQADLARTFSSATPNFAQYTWIGCDKYLDDRHEAFTINERVNADMIKVLAIKARHARKARSIHRQQFKAKR